MRLQVLVATMDQKDHSLLEKMNIQTEAIVCNQCDRYEVEEFKFNDYKIRWLSFSERGVGLNRNNALMRADSDIALFSDDDMAYVDNYQHIVKKAFEDIPDADVIVFDLTYPRGGRRPITKIKRLRKKDCMRFGAARLAVRLHPVQMNGISFNLCFGGGARFSSGEDTLFLNDCLNRGLKIYSYPAVIAHLQDDRESTWFKGYNDKFFFDKGVLFGLLNKKLGYIFAAYHCIKHRKKYSEYGWKNALKQMRRGIRYAKSRHTQI